MSISDARVADGLRMVCLRGVPSPWTEAARGLFYVKGLDCKYAAQKDGDPDDALVGWTGDSSVPVVAYEREPLRTGWAQILLLSERLAPQPALVPADPVLRADMFGVAHEICGEMGFGWAYRLLMTVRALGHERTDADFPPEIATTLGRKYGMNPTDVAASRQRVLDVLTMLSGRLQDCTFLVGDALSAADVYWATFANLIVPLDESLLPAVPMIRRAYTCADDEILAAVSERLRAHQLRIYREFLELPVPL